MVTESDGVIALEPDSDLVLLSEPDAGAVTEFAVEPVLAEPVLNGEETLVGEPITTEPTTEAPVKTSRAGRNLPAATAVGLGLLAVIALALAFRPEPFVVLVAIVIGAGLWELKEAFAHAKLDLPIWPLLAGMVAMVVSAFLWGSVALLTAFVATAAAVAIWQIAQAYLERTAISRREIVAGIFTAAYLPLMASFLILLLSQHNGNWRIALLILLSVANDTGGYFAGVLFGKHPMAPTVSPKKSWEGFIGSVFLTTVIGILGSRWLLGLPWTAPGRSGLVPSLFSSAIWLGILLGLMTAVTSTLGDLSESLLKRDLGIKDMGNILPGHGGILDRCDSILFSAPFVFLLLSIADQHRIFQSIT